MPASDLSRAKVSEPAQNFPDELTVVARWGKQELAFIITKEEFFGLGAQGAPITGDTILQRINVLRQRKPEPKSFKETYEALPEDARGLKILPKGLATTRAPSREELDKAKAKDRK